MYSFLEKNKQWLLPVFLILFIMEMVTFPYVADLTYAGRSESPEHVLTYTPNKLTWDNSTNINEDGVAELSLFNVVYDNAASENNEDIVAPGLEGSNVIRLKNNAIGEVKYTAVLYSIRSNDKLPVQVAFDAANAKDTSEYMLPENISDENVIRAVSGSLNKSTIQDFDISWKWDYYTSDQQDEIDTALGNKDEADNIIVGLYIIVEDSNVYGPVQPTVKTGDSARMSTYCALLCISAIVMILLIRERKGEVEECLEATVNVESSGCVDKNIENSSSKD